jgi:hypothetical protein
MCLEHDDAVASRLAPQPLAGGPRMSEHTVIFRLADPEHQLAGVRLVQDARIPGDQLGFHRGGDRWELVIDRPPVNRMEYLLDRSCCSSA